MNRTTSTVPLFHPRAWASSLAALVLAGSLAGCGALASSGQTGAGSSTPASSSSSGDAGTRGEKHDSTHGENSANGKEQPAGKPDDPRSWLLSEKYAPVTGLKSNKIEVEAGDAPFELSFTLSHPNMSHECASAATTLNETQFPSTAVATTVFGGTITPALASGDEPMIKVVAVTTADAVDIMDSYTEVVAACADIEGAPKVTVEKPFGGEGVHVELDHKDIVITGKSHGTHHIVLIMSNVDHDEAKAVIDAQIDLFERSVGNAK